MAMIRITQQGDFSKTLGFLKKLSKAQVLKILNRYGQLGVDALRAATPKRTGKTAESWGYEINANGSYAQIVWSNSNENQGRYIAVLIQYGHGLPQGGYVAGIDYINPAMRPVFEQIANEVWLEVIS